MIFSLNISFNYLNNSKIKIKKMGATAPDPNQERERKIRYYRSKQFFSAYESIKDVLMKLYEKKNWR